MSEEAIKGEDIALSVIVEQDGQEVAIPLAQWLEQNSN